MCITVLYIVNMYKGIINVNMYKGIINFWNVYNGIINCECV